MKSGHFIMKLWQTGNVGSHNIAQLKDNPKEGFKTSDEAKTALNKLHEEGNWEVTKGGYHFTIMELFWSPKA